MSLKIKVCGMRETDNILEAVELKPDFMGFIFYNLSPRYTADILDPKITHELPENIKKSGVFVNADFIEITWIARKYSLDLVQLHGNETPDLCRLLTGEGIKVIKALHANENTNFESFSDFIPHTEYFLFDTATSEYGGSGNKFDWKIIDKYHLGHPFFLSGGICENDVKQILEINNPEFYGIDLNSRFEIRPGLKDIKKLRKFISDIRFKNEEL